MKARYDNLDHLMSEKLTLLKPDLTKLPNFMRKLRMMMIPSLGYFTVVNKCDQLYLDFINDSLT